MSDVSDCDYLVSEGERVALAVIQLLQELVDVSQQLLLLFLSLCHATLPRQRKMRGAVRDLT